MFGSAIHDGLSSDAGKRLLEKMERREKLLGETMAILVLMGRDFGSAPVDLCARIRKELEP
jgi:hypothetical protein